MAVLDNREKKCDTRKRKDQKRKEEERGIRVSRIIADFDFIDVDGSDIPFGAFYGFLWLFVFTVKRTYMLLFYSVPLCCVIIDMRLPTTDLTL